MDSRRAPPEYGAVVMGTGIVSSALALDGAETISRILLVICAGACMVLGALLGARRWRDRERERVRREARSPAAMTGVAATEVLGTRLAVLGWHWAGIALLVIAVVLWLTLLGPVLSHWTVPTIGGRWSTVFPLGMYAACSFAVGSAATIGAATSFAQVWVWIAFAVWAVVFLAMVLRGGRAVRSGLASGTQGYTDSATGSGSGPASPP